MPLCRFCHALARMLCIHAGGSISCSIACAPRDDSDQPNAQADQFLRCPPEDASDPQASKTCLANAFAA